MLIDLISMDNYVHYNIKIAEILGLHQAIYLSELLNINEKAVRKDKTRDNFFTVDRDYITKRTTLSLEEQMDIDKSLLEIGLLKVNPDCRNTLTLNVSVLTSIISGDEDTVADLKKIVSKVSSTKAKPKTKAQQQKELMKTYVKTTNPELYSAYCDWIDAVYAKLGWMSKKAVTVGETLVDQTSNHDLDVALEILEIATVNGYKDMTWAVKRYNDNSQLNYRIKQKTVPQQERTVDNLSEEVF